MRHCRLLTNRGRREFFFAATLVAQTLSANDRGSQTAPNADPPRNEASALQEIVVTGRYEFLQVDTSGTTNLPLAIEKVPQSISLVSSDFIKAADLKTLGEIAEYTPGALNAGNPQGFGTEIALRGFGAAQTVDGVNVGVLGGSTYEPDYAIIDRLEIVKGPSSVVYGISSPGGLVNFVTKSSTRDTPSYLSVQGGMWNAFRVEAQAAGGLDAEGRVRAIGVLVQDQGNSFTDEVKHRSSVVYGGLNAQLSDSLSGYLHGGYQRQVRTAFDGIPTEADGSPAPVPRSFFIGSPNMELTSDVYHAESDLTWHADETLDLSLKGNYRKVKTVGPGPYSFDLQPNGDLGVAIQNFPDGGLTDYGVGVSGIFRLDGFGLTDSFVSVAALFQDDHNVTDASEGLFDGQLTGTANIFSGEAAITRLFNSATIPGATIFSDIEVKTLTISAQSILKVFDRFSVLIGSSYSRPDILDTLNGVVQDHSDTSQVSYRAGLTYEIAPATNAYISFSQSFLPQTLIDVSNNVLPPLSGEEYEGGLKYRSASGRLLLTGAVFQIKQSNAGQFDTTLNGLDRYRAIGEVKHDGVELQALGRLSRQWQVNAGYSYLDPKVIKDSDPTIVGKQSLFLPKETASVFTTYTFEMGLFKGLSIGGGAKYVGSQQTAYDRSTKDLPGYTIADATLGYAVGGWMYQLNAHNILNRRYFINNYSTLFYGNVIGTPANVAVSIRRNF